MTIIYGIKNCETVKKATKWCAEHGVEYDFHDYKKMGADVEILRRAVEQFGWEKVLNRRGTTWRKLPENEQQKIVDAESAIALMCEQTSIIKRPIIAVDHTLLLGFNADEYEQNLR